MGGEVRVYNSGEHQISGFSQQQGGDRSLTFTSQHGVVRLADLALVSPRSDPAKGPVSPAPSPSAQAQAWAASAPAGATAAAKPQTLAMEDIVKTIERLAELRQKNILTEEEFSAKKADLLGRL